MCISKTFNKLSRPIVARLVTTVFIDANEHTFKSLIAYISWVRKRIVDLNDLSASKQKTSLIESIEINLQAVSLRDYYENEEHARELHSKMQELVLSILNMPLDGHSDE